MGDNKVYAPIGPIPLEKSLSDKAERLTRLEIGLKRCYDPMSPIKLLSKLKAKLERLIIFVKGHKSFSAPRLPREL